MPGSASTFAVSFRRHLAAEQRRAVLEALRDRVEPEHTVGEVVDAAIALGWGDAIVDLSLADFATALLGDAGEAASKPAPRAPAEDDEDEDEDDEDEEDEDEDEAPPPARRGRAAASPAAAKATAKKSARGKPAPVVAKPAPKGKAAAVVKPKPGKPAVSGKGSGKASGKGTGKGPAKPVPKVAAPKAAAPKAAAPKAAATPAPKPKGKAAKRRLPIDVDDRMSVEEAAEVFLPIVSELGEATMQDLEEATQVSRRKLRFHIGQLVANGHLARHGMGRGTFYTVA